MENELIKMIEEMLFDNKAVGGIMPNTAKKAKNLIKKVRKGKKGKESTEALHKHFVVFSEARAEVCKKIEAWRTCDSWKNNCKCLKDCPLHLQT